MRCDQERAEGAFQLGRRRVIGAESVRAEQMFMSRALPEPRAGAAVFAAPLRASLRRMGRQPPNHALQPTAAPLSVPEVAAIRERTVRSTVAPRGCG